MINIESKMQKGGIINYVKDEKSKDKEKWVGSHPASKKEAEALNLLGFKPTLPSITTITCRVYKNITINDNNYNDSIYSLYHKLTDNPKKQEKIINLFKEAYKLRIEENKKFKSPTKGHIYYPATMKNVPYGLKFAPVGSPNNRRKTIKKKSNAPKRFISRLSRFDLLSPQGRRDSVRFINFDEELAEAEAEAEALDELIKDLKIGDTTKYSENASKKTRKRRKIRKRKDTRIKKKKRENKEIIK